MAFSIGGSQPGPQASGTHRCLSGSAGLCFKPCLECSSQWGLLGGSFVLGGGERQGSISSSWQVHAGADGNAGFPALSVLLLHLEVRLSHLHGRAHDCQHHPAGSQPPRLQCVDQRGGEHSSRPRSRLHPGSRLSRGQLRAADHPALPSSACFSSPLLLGDVLRVAARSLQAVRSVRAAQKSPSTSDHGLKFEPGCWFASTATCCVQDHVLFLDLNPPSDSFRWCS